jgi:hypothetical protein
MCWEERKLYWGMRMPIIWSLNLNPRMKNKREPAGGSLAVFGSKKGERREYHSRIWSPFSGEENY